MDGWIVVGRCERTRPITAILRKRYSALGRGGGRGVVIVWGAIPVAVFVLIRLPKPETDRVPRLAWRAGAVVDGRVVAHAAGRVGAFLRERQLGRARRTGARVCHLEWCRSAGRGARLGHRAWMAFWARRGWLCDGQLRRPARLGWLGRLVKVFDEETAGCACCSLGGRGGCLLGRRGRVVVCEGRAGGGAARARVCRGGWVAQLVEECGHGDRIEF